VPTTIAPSDVRFESLFQRWGLKWEFVPELSLADQLKVLDEAQVRDLAHIAPTERVHEYALQMKGGATFPPIVLMAPNILIDGNTRAQAGRQAGRTHLPAYRVEVPDLDFAKMLAAALNQMGGARLTPEEANKSAIRMMNLGWPDESIGRELGYAAESVRRWRREAEFSERSSALDLNGYAAKLTKKQRQDVAKIVHDEPFAEMVKLIADTKPDPKDLKELAQVVEKAPSDEQAVEAIKTARVEWVPVGPDPRKVYRNKSAQQLRMHLGALVGLLATPSTVYDAAGAEKDVPRIRQAIEGLQAVLSFYEARTETS
jgi:hypothetical protein